jgi:hypothetical protein
MNAPPPESKNSGGVKKTKWIELMGGVRVHFNALFCGQTEAFPPTLCDFAAR